MTVKIEGIEFTIKELFAVAVGKKAYGVQMHKRNENGIWYGVQFTKSRCGHYYYRLMQYNGEKGKWHRIRKVKVVELLELYSKEGFTLGY